MKVSILPLICLLFLLNSSVSFSQQLPLFTQYREYHSFINPATINPDYLTQEYNLRTGISYRGTIAGIEGAPSSVFLNGEYLLRTKGAFDLLAGTSALSYDTDPFRTSGVYGRLAALFTKDPFYGAFSIGLTFGAVQYRVNVDNLNPFDSNDLIIPNSNQQKMSSDVGLGAFYYKQFKEGSAAGDVFYTGLSIPQFLGLRTQFNDNSGGFSYQQERHYYGLGGYYKYLDEQSYIHPSVWIRYVPNAPIQVDLNAQYMYKRIFWLGGGYSTADILHFEGGFYVNTASYDDKSCIKIGYGFDYALSEYNNIIGTAHEINLSFLLFTGKRY